MFWTPVSGSDSGLLVAVIDFAARVGGVFAMDLNNVLMFDTSNQAIASAPPGDSAGTVAAASAPPSAAPRLGGLLAVGVGVWLRR